MRIVGARGNALEHRHSVPLVGFPRATVPVKRTRLKTGPARGTDQCPRAGAVRDDAVQRGADQLAALAGFDSRSDGFGHGFILSDRDSFGV